MKFLNYTQTNKFFVGMHRVRLKIQRKDINYFNVLIDKCPDVLIQKKAPRNEMLLYCVFCVLNLSSA